MKTITVVSQKEEVNGLRSNYSFAMISGEPRRFGDCDMEIEGRKAEPPPPRKKDSPRFTRKMLQDFATTISGVKSSVSLQAYDPKDLMI